ncbi:MAG: hydrolase [Acidimicrobiales bacterium]
MSISTESLRSDLDGRLDELAANVVALAEINSGSYNPDGVNRVGERLAELVGSLKPTSVETLPVEPSPGLGQDGQTTVSPVGDALRARKRPDAPFQVCLFGHLDTVFAPDNPFQNVTAEGRRLLGPGVADCKGGLVLATEVLRYLDTVEWGEQVGWELLTVPDEEIGSLSSKGLLREAAESADLGLGFEPALPSGGVAAARKGSLTGHLLVRGLAAHAGRAHAEGRSAILGLSAMIVELEAHNSRRGLTVNCGRISGGGALNVVPDFAMASFNMRVEAAEDQHWIEQRFDEAAATAKANFEVDVDVVWTSARPPKVRTAELDQMLHDVSNAATTLGFTVTPEDTGGCCDGNDMAAAGLTNVDSLGIAGGGIHSSNEFADIDSIPERAAMVAEVLHRAYLRSLNK